MTDFPEKIGNKQTDRPHATVENNTKKTTNKLSANEKMKSKYDLKIKIKSYKWVGEEEGEGGGGKPVGVRGRWVASSKMQQNVIS